MWAPPGPRGAIQVSVRPWLEVGRMAGVEGGPGTAGGREGAGKPEAEERGQLMRQSWGGERVRPWGHATVLS